jgi:soluble lytic murein transglycosylase-like protein
MRNVEAIMVLLLSGLVLLGSAGPSLAQGYESVGVRHAAHHVKHAKRDLARAKAHLREAQATLSDTRRYIGAYGVNVGRWVWLAGDVGWPRGELGTLMFVIERESGGSPLSDNTQGSGAAGLLQLMPGWYAGDYYDFPDFDPHVPRLNLKYGYLGWLVDGWIPWSL